MKDQQKLARTEKPIVISLLDDGGNCRPQALADAVNFARSGKVVQLLAAWAEVNTRRTIAEDVAWAKSVIELLAVTKHEFSFIVRNMDDNRKVIVLACRGDAAGKTVLHLLLDQSVATLELSIRAANALQNENIRFVGEIVGRTDDELKRSKNIGSKSLKEIKEIIAGFGLVTGMNTENWTPPA